MAGVTDFSSSQYLPPGVFTSIEDGPQLGGISNAPTAVAIFGDTQRFSSDVETIVIPADVSSLPVDSQVLRHSGIITSSIVILNTATNVTYTVTTDYTLTNIPNGSGTRDDQTKIKRTLAGTLAAGTVVQISYNYTDPNYFNVYSFTDYNNLRAFYGEAFTSTGAINSELTLAAQLAFVNGANQIITVAVDAAASTPTTTEFAAALAKLLDEPDVAVIVPAVGDSAIFSYVKAHVENESSQYKERRAIVGIDGSVTAVGTSARKSAAAALSSTRVALVSPATINFYNSQTAQFQILGAQYMAAAVAGLAVSQLASLPLTHKVLNGITDMGEKVPETDKNAEAQSGLMVVEKARSGAIRIRHGLTTNTAGLLEREWNILGQQDALVFRIRDYLETDSIIGSVIDDLTLTNVKSASAAALESLVAQRVIVAYTDLQVRQLVTTPDVVEVRFAWQPELAMNYISVKISISVTAGTATLA